MTGRGTRPPMRKLQLHPMVDQIGEQADEKHLHTRESEDDREQTQMAATVGVEPAEIIDGPFDNAQKDQHQSRRNKDIERLEIGADADDVKKIYASGGGGPINVFVFDRLGRLPTFPLEMERVPHY